MNAEDVLKYGHRTVLNTLDRLPDPSTWDTEGVCGWWSARQIIAHLASFEHLLVDLLCTLQGEPAGPTLQRYLSVGPGQFNDLEVADREGMTPGETLADYSEAQARTMTLIQLVPPERRRQPGLVEWYGKEYDLEDLIAYQYYGHKREHSAQIAVFADSLGA